MPATPAMMQRAQEFLRAHQASEIVRKQQQGHGKPIISLTHHDYRLVAVGKTIYWDKNWVVFHDFVLSFLKHALGNEWGKRENVKGVHPLFRWFRKFQKYGDTSPTDGKLKCGEMTGFIACWLHLGYALYLIAHNDELPKPLLRRLRNPATVMPAYYESIVGAALAVSGFELSCAETKASSAPTPEFRATSKRSGTVYEVEAKRKDAWKVPTTDVNSEEFHRELESYVRGQLYAASRKKLTNPVFWFELSIPTLTSETDWLIVAAKVQAVLHDAERTMTVGGAPIAPAFIVVTNHTFLANEDIPGDPAFAFLTAIRIDDYPIGKVMEIESALEGYDKHRDIFWMMEAWKISRRVPATFDGTPPQLMSRDGVPQRTIKIGEQVEATDMDGRKVIASVEEIMSTGDTAVVALYANGKHWLAKMPLTKGEANAAREYSDAIFGRESSRRNLREDDPFDLYDFFLHAHANMTQEQADKFFAENANVSHYRNLPLEEARIRIARELTKWAWFQSKHKGQTA